VDNIGNMLHDNKNEKTEEAPVLKKSLHKFPSTSN
jgi:hypothetical protein